MDDQDRDDILTEIQVNTAVTRERVEHLTDDVAELKDTTDRHHKRISGVEKEQQKTNSHLATVGGVASVIGACIVTVVGKVTQWF